MIGRVLRRFWTHLLIVFYDNYTIEGFEKTSRKFELPADLSQLDPVGKRKATICNLFANQNLSIRDIVHVLDSSLHQVIPTLIENGLIKERRRDRRHRGDGPAPATAGRKMTLSILPDDAVAKPSPAEGPPTASTSASSDDASRNIIGLPPDGRRMVS
jgi:hypothetical protein